MKDRRVSIRFITERQSRKDKAEKLAKMICQEIGENGKILIEKYYKFENSYEITIEFDYKAEKDFTHEMIAKTDKICTPWFVTYDCERTELEMLMFDAKVGAVRFRRNEFGVISWGVIEWEEVS